MQPPYEKARELRKDIFNIPNHVFGEHKRCKERRKCENDFGTKNYVLLLKLHGLYGKIQNAFMYIAAYSDSLLLNLTNNPAEAFIR